MFCIKCGQQLPEDAVFCSKCETKVQSAHGVPAQPQKTAAQLNDEGLQFCNERNYSAAVALFQQAAAQGHADAQYNLGQCYHNGDGVPKDMAKAAEWCGKAAAQGDAKAQYNLGDCYYNGDGVPEDKAKAAEWWGKAAAQGDANAQFKLGVCYYSGDGVPEDKAKAAEWYGKAAAQGDTGAKQALAAIGA
jgi:TPR repeat protein